MTATNITDQLKGPYGTTGVQVFEQIQRVITKTITYDNAARVFTVLETKDFSKIDFEKLLGKETYIHWHPEVQEDTDSFGNRQFRLVSGEKGAQE